MGEKNVRGLWSILEKVVGCTVTVSMEWKVMKRGLTKLFADRMNVKNEDRKDSRLIPRFLNYTA